MVIDGFDPIEELRDYYTYEKVEVIVPTVVLNEIKSKANSPRFSERSKARVALNYLEAKRGVVQVVESEEGKTDEVVLRLCKENGYYLFTADMGLKNAAKRSGVKVIVPRRGGKTINFI